MDNNDPSWGTVAEAAKRVGLSTMTIRRYIDQGRIPARRLGPRLVRVDLRAVDQLFTIIEPTAAVEVAP
jgi:excisionase family DNA binding protein